MIATPAERGDDARREAQGLKIRKVGSGLPCLKDGIQYLIILIKKTQDLPLVCAAVTRLPVMMPDAALIAAELLVRTSISYLVPTFQTHGRSPHNTFIFHSTLIMK